MIKIYRTYNKVKDIFKKPIIKWYIGKWQHSPGLPVWRRGNTIYLAKYGEYESEWNYARMINCSWTDLGKKNHPILSKLFKPIYQLPIWLSFYIFNLDVQWKTKWDEYRFERPPQFTIVLFGYCLTIWLQNPTGKVEYDDDYWEAILYYIDYKDIDKVKQIMGHYTENWGTAEEITKPCLNSKFLK